LIRCLLEIKYFYSSCQIDWDSLRALKLLAPIAESAGLTNDLVIKEAFELGIAEFDSDPWILLALVENIAIECAELSFEARCTGDEFRSTWIREYVQGTLKFAAGPWDYEW
jgi:hypothetical protein